MGTSVLFHWVSYSDPWCALRRKNVHTFFSSQGLCPCRGQRRTADRAARESSERFPEVTHFRRLSKLRYMCPCGEEMIAIQNGFRVRRWIVEVVHSWFNRFRKLLVGYENANYVYESLPKLAASIIIFQQIQTLFRNIFYIWNFPNGKRRKRKRSYFFEYCTTGT